MRHNFGYFVLNKALCISSDFDQKRILNVIKKNYEKLNEKKLVNKWKKVLKKYEMPSPNLKSINDNNNDINNNKNYKVMDSLSDEEFINCVKLKDKGDSQYTTPDNCMNYNNDKIND